MLTNIVSPDVTLLEQTLDRAQAAHPGLSGFHIFETGVDSLAARLSIIAAAQETLDLQYYAISDSVSSNLLIYAVIKAAERGVRVRLLIDDISAGEIKKNLIALDGIAHVHIRVYNPLNKHDQSWPARLYGAITHRNRATRRMHNKVLACDNTMAIIGGRNLGDEYFDTHETIAFKDIDVLAIGPAVKDIMKSFDDFWNDKHSFAIFEIHKTRARKSHIRAIREKLEKNWQESLQQDEDRQKLEPNFENLYSGLVWAKSIFVADPTSKMNNEGLEGKSAPLQQLKKIVEDARDEFIIISAYFVPGERGTAWLSSLRERGMRIGVLTNSLASTDVVAVHIGYRNSRKTLLQKNVSIHELKPRGKRTRQRLLGRRSPSHASLHAKAYIVDNRYAVIGSFNFDPRSAHLNTELCIFIDSPVLAGQLKKMYTESTSPEASYHAVMRGDTVCWKAKEKGEDIEFSKEPGSSFWRRLQVNILSLLPIEDQL